MQYLLALDQGTTSSRTLLFDLEGNVIALAQEEFEQHYPQSGWVEHNPLDIWQSQLNTMKKVFSEHGDKITAINRKSTRLNSSHVAISYAVFCLKKKTIP